MVSQHNKIEFVYKKYVLLNPNRRLFRSGRPFIPKMRIVVFLALSDTKISS